MKILFVALLLAYGSVNCHLMGHWEQKNYQKSQQQQLQQIQLQQPQLKTQQPKKSPQMPCQSCDSHDRKKPVCARDKAKKKMRLFFSVCEFVRFNCRQPKNRFSFLHYGVCFPSSTTRRAVTSLRTVTKLSSGVSGHRNIGLVNSDDCGQFSPLKARILNGKDAGLLQYPWLVLVTIDEVKAKGKEFSCGGSLINKRYVLTAAHCAEGFSTDVTITVRLGEYDVSQPVDCARIQGALVCADPPQNIRVAQVVLHERYRDASVDGFDIALMRLERPARYADSVKPICLPVGKKEEQRSFDGEMLTVAGWGVTVIDHLSDVLQSVTLPAVANSRCKSLFSASDVAILPSQLCAGGKDLQDSCEGDSGGPLMHEGFTSRRMVVYGLVSYGPECGTTSLPGVYTRVGFYMKWILDNITE